MANTTFNGPVRSYNGFLELVDNEWVPIQGGGGSSDATVLPFESGEQIVPITASSEGENFTLAGEFGNRAGGGLLTFSATAPGVIWCTVFVTYVNNIDGVGSTVNDNTVTVPMLGYSSWTADVTYQTTPVMGNTVGIFYIILSSANAGG